MRFYEFVSEARRKPELNPRSKGHSAAVKYLEQIEDLSHIGVRMTSIPKLGLNPMSTYNTPFGICFYPAEYYMKIKKEGMRNGELPFQDEAEYVQVFSWTSDRVLDIGATQFNVDEYNSIMKNLKEIYDPQIIDGLWKQSAKRAMVSDSTGGRLWYVFRELSENNEKTSGKLWGYLLRKLGYDIVIDNGEGIIHPSEPTQSIILNPRIVTHMEQIERDYQGPATHPTRSRHSSLNLLVAKAVQTGDRLSRKAEKEVAKYPDAAGLYASEVLRKPWPEAESAIGNSRWAYKYASEVLNGRFPKGEDNIAQDSEKAFYYAKDVLKGRFPKGEPAIAERADLSYNYALNVLKAPFPMGEHAIAMYHTTALEYATNVLNHPHPKTWGPRINLANSPKQAVEFARDVLKGPYPEAEPAIAQDAAHSYRYAKDVLKGRFPAGEAVIAKNADFAIMYTMNILKKPWPEAEPAIAKSDWSIIYGQNVLKDQDPSTWAQQYLQAKHHNISA